VNDLAADLLLDVPRVTRFESILAVRMPDSPIQASEVIVADDVGLRRNFKDML
jgi:hypothetical protein